jgi:radical SAM protein with 4Fe4S-binding SPASM domain
MFRFRKPSEFLGPGKPGANGRTFIGATSFGRSGKPSKIQKLRFEHFGGIIGTEDPASLIWVDRDYLLARGFDGTPVWEGEAPGYLTAPVEMEIAVTTRCNLSCPCCYVSSSPCGGDVEPHVIEGALEVASKMGVFHVAFGGGEPLLHPGLLGFAQKARRLGLLPSITTNGTLVTRGWADQARDVFARVNVSVDLSGGPRDSSVSIRETLNSLRILLNAGVTSGVNFIVTSHNIQRLGQLFYLARETGADSILLLRVKPSGRGGQAYLDLSLDGSQQARLIPEALALSRKHHIPFHLDCALAPLLLNSGADRKVMDVLGASGCIAGQLLVTVDSDGIVHPCSHLDFGVGPVEDLPDLWRHDNVWGGFRDRESILAGKCVGCGVKDLCRGGCAAVNEFKGLALSEPDDGIKCR